MQHCSCFVYLSGDQYHGVRKPDVTVAEIVMLRAIHGDDAVTAIQPTFMAKTKQGAELERLRNLYTSSNVTKDGRPLIDDVFPGRNPKLPVNLADIDIEYGADGVQDAQSEAPELDTAPNDHASSVPTKRKPSKASDALLGSSDGE